MARFNDGTFSNIACENVRAGLRKMYTKQIESGEEGFIENVRRCNCRVIVFKNGDIAVQSYSTVVAYYIDEYDTLYVLGYYSTTTSKHISIVRSMFSIRNVVWLYDRSDRDFIDTCRCKVRRSVNECLQIERGSNTAMLTEIARLNRIIGDRV